MPSVDDVKRMMDDLYAANRAYQTSLPFDTMRGDEIRAATLRLAGAMAADSEIQVLDVGCGEGGIASFWPHQNIVGIEISDVAVQKARKAYPLVSYHCLPVEHVAKLRAGPFCLVVAQESIEHWTEVPMSLVSIRAKMVRGGSFVLTTPNRDSLHCRIARKLGFNAPYCSYDHIHEFGYQELVDTVEAAGFVWRESAGASFAPVWALEHLVGGAIRNLTDRDEEVNAWMNDIGRVVPQYAFIQCHRFEVL